MKPILFNIEMVKAILDGKKTQTRRVATSSNRGNIVSPKLYETGKCFFHELNNGGNFFIKAKYKTGDILYVLEQIKINTLNGECTNRELKINYSYLTDIHTDYLVSVPDRFYGKTNYVLPDWISWFGRYKSIRCIKEMARIFLKVTNVSVERLQDITTDNIKKEGIYVDCNKYSPPMSWNEAEVCIDMDYSSEWKKLWNKTTKDGCKWEDNPYVFVYEFERVESEDE